jgi:NADPH:quinone reductase-like Zn-dependent oxidoreductase
VAFGTFTQRAEHEAHPLVAHGIQQLASGTFAGAAGAVGTFAAELAAHRGQSVYAVASAQDETFVRGLSAVFVPRSADPASAIRAAADGPVDAVLDTAGIGGAALGAVRDGGTFVITIPPTAPPARPFASRRPTLFRRWRWRTLGWRRVASAGGSFSPPDPPHR